MTTARFIQISVSVLGLGLLGSVPVAAETILLPNPDFENGAAGWVLSAGAGIIAAPAGIASMQGSVVSLATGAYGNAFLDFPAAANTSDVFTVALAPAQAAQATDAKLTVFLHRGAETQGVTVLPVRWEAGSPDTQSASVEYVSAAVPETDWKLGFQILSQNQAVMADAVSLSATPVPPPILLEGDFGRVEIDVNKPSLTSLTLRRADGTLEPHSLLSPKGVPWMRSMPAWGTQALTFAVDETGRRFESRTRAPESVEQTANGVTLHGVVLADGAGDPVAREDWTLQTEGDELVWTVERTWLRGLTTTSTGTPALFFSTRPINSNPSTVLPNAVATTFWITPEKLHAWYNPFYRPAEFPFGYKLALENNVVATEPGGWAVLKLFPAWQNESEPRFAATGGHLYRRGHFGWLSEAGVVSHPETQRVYQAAELETCTLRISAVPAAASGHQLAVTAEDPSGTVDTLSRYYGALFNGGCVNDQAHYNFGNETDGWYYGGASWMKGLPMLAGVPATDAASSHPIDLPRAFRDNLQMILGTEFQPGLTRFGYNSQGAYTDDNIIQIIGGRAYYLYSGDIDFVRQNLPFYRRAVDWYLRQRNADGLVSLSPAHWYYDAMIASGVTTYHNAFLYRALVDLAGMERAAGNSQRAAAQEAEAATLKADINRVLWWEEAPNGPRYVDWIQPDGTKIAYGADLCQFPPVAFGIASPEQATKLLATIDNRIAELESGNGYAGYASRSAYWPVPASVNTHPVNQGFGSYMNGGSFLCMTYWEIMARAAAGDAEGAWKRLKKFAEGTRLTGGKGFIGNNWVMEDGSIGFGAGDEPYLSDAIAVPGALVQGILGIRQTNDILEVNPVLPAALQNVSAEVMHLGMRKRVTIQGGNVTIQELGRAFFPPDELVWRVNAGSPPAADLHIDRSFESGNAWSATPEIELNRGEGIVLKSGSLSGSYTTAPCDWGQVARLIRLRTNATLNDGGINARIEASNDGFKTIVATQSLALQEGDGYLTPDQIEPARQARVTFTLTMPASGQNGPVLQAVEFAANTGYPAIAAAQSNLIVSYGGDSLGLFTDTGTKIRDFATDLVNPQGVATDDSGHVYVAEYGTPGAYDGNVRMYDIASGAFIRNVVQGLYNFTGLAFNPAHPGEIIVMGQYNSGNTQLGRWNTSATNVNSAANSALGAPYAGLYYNAATSGGAAEGIYAAAPAGAVQQYGSTSLAWGSPAIPDIGIAGPNGITGLGTNLFFASNGGVITKNSGGVLTTVYHNPGDNYYGITTDGMDLWVAQYSSGYAGRYSTSGELTGYFAIASPVGIAYTTLGGMDDRYSTWAEAFHAPPLSDPASTADPDHDGLPNAMEYALGLDPRHPSASPGVLINNGTTLTFTKGAGAKVNGDVTYRIETSTTLGAAPNPWIVNLADVTNGADTIAITFPAGSARNFARLKVILATP